MKIELHDKPAITIEEFAEKHDLVMTVHCRNRPPGAPDRYYAKFKDAEIGDGRFLSSAFGDGPTPEAAIQAYAEDIRCKKLVINAYQIEQRREIEVPWLITTTP